MNKRDLEKELKAMMDRYWESQPKAKRDDASLIIEITSEHDGDKKITTVEFF